MSSVYFRSIWNTNNLFIKNGAINTPSYNTVDQNNLIAEYGQILFNSTTNTVNFFSNTGTWNPIVPTNNITIGNLNFNNNTISSTTGDIILYPNSAVVKITGALNMQTNNIINVGTINTLALPTSTFVGINDSQVLTNKTINGSQLVNNSVSLAKMSTLTANSIIGNNTGVSATPLALDVNNVRAMLFLNLVENISLSTWGGSIYLNTVAPGAISLAEMANLSANTIIGNNTGVSATPIALSVSNVKTMLGLDNNLTIGNLNFNNNTISSTTGDVNIIPLSKTINFSLDTINLNPGLYNQVLIQTTPTVSSLSIQSPSFIEIITTGSPGTIYFTSTAIISETKYFSSFQDDYNSISQNSVNIQAGGTHIMFNHNNKMSITLNNGASYLEIIGTLDMKTNNIINVGTINTFALPTSTFVGINDSQVLTNKTINGSQLVDNSVSLSKMSTLTANSIIGNNTGVSATPIALNVSQVRSLLSVNLVENQSLSSWTGNNAIIMVGNVASGNLVAGFGTINCGAITSDSITAKTTNSNLTLNGNGTGTVNTNAPYIYIANNRIDTDTSISLDGTTVTKSRYVACYQNAVHKLGFGLAASSYFFIWDNVNARDLFQASILNGNIRFPTYTTDGMLKIVGGTVTVDTNFTTSTNNINCNSITSNSTVLLLNGTGVNANVATNNSTFLVSSTVVSSDSYVGINGPTTTNGRYIACYQAGAYRCGFGLSGTSYFFVNNGSSGTDLLMISMAGGGQCVRLPTYSSLGTMQVSANGTLSSSSDRRLKHNEEILIPSNSLEQIMNLQPKTFTWNDDKDNRINIGFIAQDVETAIPEAIDGKKYEFEFIRDGVSQGVEGTVRVDEEGKPVLDYTKPRYRGLNQCAILAVLVSAFQELHNNINIKLSSIENRLTVLETVINNS
uniref:Peptidase S74 domain-containing protein n=1 Tax=viral metagenome TaxID=1070528 RepID=A0A6C0BBT3_9ZZZZ